MTLEKRYLLILLRGKYCVKPCVHLKSLDNSAVEILQTLNFILHNFL